MHLECGVRLGEGQEGDVMSVSDNHVVIISMFNPP
jgi:hypothetical protein